jgi:hypothetical protein
MYFIFCRNIINKGKDFVTPCPHHNPLPTPVDEILTFWNKCVYFFPPLRKCFFIWSFLFAFEIIETRAFSICWLLWNSPSPFLCITYVFSRNPRCISTFLSSGTYKIVCILKEVNFSSLNLLPDKMFTPQTLTNNFNQKTFVYSHLNKKKLGIGNTTMLVQVTYLRHIFVRKCWQNIALE